MKKPILFLLFVYTITNTVLAQLTGPLSMTSAQGNFSQYLSRSAIAKNAENAGSKSAVITDFNNAENVKGERFLFNTWVSGNQVIDIQGTLINTSSYLFNFDKLTGSLLVTENKADVMSVSPQGIRSFQLEGKGKSYLFQHIQAIDSTQFYLQLAGKESQYFLYKMFKVKFVKSNFRDDGLIQTGNRYDEYVDESQYYIIRPEDGTSRVITLKPKDIKNTLVAQKEKVSAYFSQHKEDDINERFLTGLIDYLNN